MSAEAFLKAREFLFANRTDYDTAYRDFRWPVLDQFNWALDYFDRMAHGNERPALWIVNQGSGGETGTEVKISFAEMAERSNRVANYLRGLGVGRGDRILLMLGNVVPLWEVMLAAMKLGAVTIPATTLLTRDDLIDRFDRGRARHVVTSSDNAAKFADIPGDYTRIAVGDTVPGWHDYADAGDAPARFAPDGETRATDPLLLYFTSGTTAKPKLVLHSHQSYPVGSLSTMYWIGLQPGRHPPQHFLARLGQACLELRLYAVGGRGLRVHAQPAALQREGAARRDRALPGDDVLRAADRVAHADPGGSEIVESGAERGGRRRRAAQPRDHRAGARRLGADHPRRLRPDRDHPAARQFPRPDGEAGCGRQAGARLSRAPARCRRRRAGRGGDIAWRSTRRRLGLMQGYQGDDGAVVPVAGAAYRTGDVAMRDADGYFTYVGRADDVFKASDYRISPFELESALIEHAAIAEAAVVPSPDPLRLAVPKAFVALAGNHIPNRETALEIFRHVRASLAPFKRVRRLEFAELPKTISGKIRRVELRTAEAERRAAGQRAEAEFWEEDFPELR